MKSGIYTTEFWLSLATTGVALLAVVLGMSPSDKEALDVAVSKAIVGASSVVAAGAVAWHYISQRTWLKEGVISVEGESPEAGEE